jgi:hypothetical protein
MPPIQPPLISAFFSWQRTKLPKNIQQSFFLSFEDALWQLIRQKQIPKGSIVLIPDFFCFDVVGNIKDHGLECQTYQVDKQLKVDQKDFVTKLKKYQPSAVIIFHPVGISNELLKNPDWLELLPSTSLLIEDCVHRLIDPNKIKLLDQRHYMIDSLRKVAPLQGSRVFSQEKIKTIGLDDWLLTLIYRSRVLFWWLLMQLALIWTYYSKNAKGDQLATIAMEKGYDIIGDQQRPSPNFYLFNYLSHHLNYQSIEKFKLEQADLYSARLNSILAKSNSLFQIPFTLTDRAQLRGFPLGIELEAVEKFLDFCRQKQLHLRLELNDSPWSLKQKIVYLPMGPHVSHKEIEEICDLLESFS